jgi:anti-sigma-K factor RskA
MTTMNHHEQNEELSWLAFRYVAGDLTVAEVEEFEERLAIDQSAREAVAQSVELYHAIAAVEASVAAQPVMIARRFTSTWSQRIAWLTTGAAAAAVLAVACWNVVGRVPSPQAKPGVSPDLATAWTAVRADLAQADEPVRPMIAELSDAELAAIADDDLVLPMDSPSWMTAAVQSLAARQPAPLDASESPPQEN